MEPSEKKEAATPETGPQTPGTTALIFPEYAEEPKKEETPPAPEEAKAETPAEEPPKPETPKEEPEYLDTEGFGTKKVKVKIGGIEKEVTLKDVIRGYQTDQYLTEKGQKIGDERRILDELRSQALRTPEVPAAPEEHQDPFFVEHVQPHLKARDEKIQSLEKMISTLTVALKPAYYQATVQKIDRNMKEIGFTDFMEKLPEIEQAIYGMQPHEQRAFDNENGFVQIYKDMKLKEMQTAMRKPKEEVRPTPPVVPVETSNVPTESDDFQSQMATAFKKAQVTGDWEEVLRLKGAI